VKIFPHFFKQTSVLAVLPSIFQMFFLALEENNKLKPRKSVEKIGKGFLLYFLFHPIVGKFSCRVGKTITWPEQDSLALCTGLKFRHSAVISDSFNYNLQVDTVPLFTAYQPHDELLMS